MSGVPLINPRPRVLYAREQDLSVEAFAQLLSETTLGPTRPLDDQPRLRQMLAGANLILTARLDRPDRRIVGIARGVTDFAWCCYIAELAVSASAQGLGIGKGLLDEARRQLGPTVTLTLVSVPEAVGFYQRAGMEPVPDTFKYQRER